MVGGLLLDIDGVLVVSWKPLAGAAECLEWLRLRGVGFRLVTNTSSRTRRQIAQILTEAGMPVDPAHILTAVSSAAAFLRDRYPDAPCLVVNEGAVGDDLEGVAETNDPGSAGVVLLGGAGPGLGYRHFDTAFKLALEGLPIIALHRNTRFQTSEGPALDMGAFIVGLEEAAGIEIPVVGKPSPAFFHAALAEIGVEPADAVMVGDDIDSDVRGAQALGLTGVLVKTGKFRASDLEGQGIPPDHVIDSVGRLPQLLERLSGSHGA